MLKRRKSKKGLAEAAKAVQKSEAQVHTAEVRSGRVSRLASTLRLLREENHWGEKMDEAFGGGKG